MKMALMSPTCSRQVWGRSWPWVAAVSGLAVVLAGCGLAANPQPPTLWLPAPVKDLTAARAGDQVHLHWTMPKNTTDKVALKGDQRAHVCWASEALLKPTTVGKPGKTAPAAATLVVAKACRAAGDGMFPPDKPADFTAKLPAELTTGEPRAVGFYVELQNHAEKTAGPSNAAWVAAGAAPPGVTGLRVETRAAGVVLHWETAAPLTGMALRIHRELEPGAGTAKPVAKPDLGNGVPPPDVQVLEVDLDKGDPGQALDRDAPLDHVWKYSAERVVRLEIEKHALEIAGPASEKVMIDAKDVFPPAVPAGLAAVADAEARAVDLSWTPDTDADLAGYAVYRRDTMAGGAMERISGSALVVGPSFGDVKVVAGRRYVYAVTAVDADGNESARSGEVEEGLPQ
jgi:hypothetical protein